MIRNVAFHNPNPNASKCNISTYQVSEMSNELWGEGVSIYHNPNAKNPLPLDFFLSAANHFYKDGILTTILPPFQSLVYSSITINFTE